MFAIALRPPIRWARAYAAPLGMLFRRQNEAAPSSNSAPGSAALALRGWRPRKVAPRRRGHGRLGAWAVAFFDLLPFWRVL